MLKKILFFAVLTAFSFSINAQFKKGDRMVGASVASFMYNSGSSEVSFPSGIQGYTSNSSSYSFRLEPSMGWFISEKTAVGGALNILPHGQKVTYKDNGVSFQEDKSNNFDIGLGAFARHYFGNAGDFYPFGQFGFNLGISSATSEGYKYYSGTPEFKNSYEGKSSGGFFANASLQAGLTKMLNENTGLDFFAGYTYSYNKNTYKTTTLTDLDLDGDIDATAENEPTTKFTNHGFFVGVGLQIFLTGKK